MNAEISLGRWVKQRRAVLDLTQRELAHQIGCSLSVIQKIEIDERRPSREIADLLAYHLELGAEEHEAFVRLARTRTLESVALPGTPQPPAARFDNLPATLTSLVGREWEVQTLGSLLVRDNVRLLTISGPPGIGKTRLALAVARRLREDFAEGACFVALAPLAATTYVVPAIARTLGIGDVERQSLIERLRAYLQSKQLLLVLDNFEHVLAAAPEVAELLESAPQLKVLVTSRALLQLYGEHEFVAPPLALPDLKHLPVAGDLAHYAAVELFVLRARAAKLDFVLSEQNARSVAELCTRLDGLPLAIELAAARSKQLAPAALLARLTSPGDEGAAHLGVLAAKAHNLPARQQTLYAAIDWSYALLSPAEQRVFRSLGVFAGGCTWAALRAVNGVPGEASANWLLDAVHSLVDKSLVVAQAGQDGEPRFSLLEMIREYALQQLADTGEADHIRRTHAEYYLAIIEVMDGPDGNQQGPMILATYPVEHNNLRAALNWGLEHEPAQYLLLAAQLADFGNDLGLPYESRDWLERALARVAPDDSRGYAHAARRMAAVLWIHGDLSTAESWIRASSERWRRIGDDIELGVALLFWSLILFHRDEYEAALPRAEEAATLLRSEPDLGWLPITLCTLGSIHCELGDYLAASTFIHEGSALFRQQGDKWGSEKWGIGLAVLSLADIAYAQGDYDTARRQYGEAMPGFQGPDGYRQVARAALSLGRCLWQQEKPEDAVDCWKEALAAARLIGAREYIADSLLLLGFAALQAGDAGQAYNLCSESLALYRQIEHDAGIAYALAGLAGVAALRTTCTANYPETSPQASTVGMLGAAARMLAGRRKVQDDVERCCYERIIESLRQRLTVDEFADAFVQGDSWSDEQCVSAVAVARPS